MQKTLPSSIRAVIFDGDGTLLKIENPYFSIASKLECLEESKQLVRAYLSDIISYRELSEQESQLFVTTFRKRFGEHPKKGDFEALLPSATVSDGAISALTAGRKRRIDIFALGSGLIDMLQTLIPLGIPEDHISANRLRYDEQGNYLGRQIEVEGDKIFAFDKILHKHGLDGTSVVYVGDSEFDRKLFEHVMKIGGCAVLIEEKKHKDFPIQNLPNSTRFLAIDGLGQMEKLLSD